MTKSPKSRTLPVHLNLNLNLKVRGLRASATLAINERSTLDTGVAILPGSAFGRPAYELTARLAYVDFDGVRVLVASEATPLDQRLDAAFLETCCGPSVEAAALVCSWAQS